MSRSMLSFTHAVSDVVCLHFICFAFTVCGIEILPNVSVIWISFSCCNVQDESETWESDLIEYDAERKVLSLYAVKIIKFSTHTYNI